MAVPDSLGDVCKIVTAELAKIGKLCLINYCSLEVLLLFYCKPFFYYEHQRTHFPPQVGALTASLKGQEGGCLLCSAAGPIDYFQVYMKKSQIFDIIPDFWITLFNNRVNIRTIKIYTGMNVLNFMQSGYYNKTLNFNKCIYFSVLLLSCTLSSVFLQSFFPYLKT